MKLIQTTCILGLLFAVSSTPVLAQEGTIIPNANSVQKPLYPGARPAPTIAPSGLDGEWETQNGILEIKTSNRALTGKYTWQYGEMEGKIFSDNRTVTGDWVEKVDEGFIERGQFVLTFSEDGKSLRGVWQYADGTESGEWTGKKLGFEEEETTKVAETK